MMFHNLCSLTFFVFFTIIVADWIARHRHRSFYCWNIWRRKGGRSYVQFINLRRCCSGYSITFMQSPKVNVFTPVQRACSCHSYRRTDWNARKPTIPVIIVSLTKIVESFENIDHFLHSSCLHLRLISVLEISTHDYGHHNDRLTAKMLNGLNEQYRTNTHSSAHNYSLEIAGKNFRIVCFLLPNRENNSKPKQNHWNQIELQCALLWLLVDFLSIIKTFKTFQHYSNTLNDVEMNEKNNNENW